MSNKDFKIDYLDPKPFPELEYGINSLFNKGYLDGRNITADSITANKIAANTITGDKLSITTDISINDTTFGNQGIQPQYNSGTPRAYIGDGSTKSFEFDGTDVNLGADTTINGRVASIISGAINSSGNFVNEVINTKLNTSTKKILKDFTFDDTDYAGAFKTGDITWDTADGSVTGGSGILMNAAGLVGANSGSTTFSIDATTGSATFAGNLSAPSGTLGTITAGTFSGVEFSQKFDITAGMDISKGDAIIIGDGSDIVLVGQGHTDDSYIECGEDSNTTYFAQPFKFHKDFDEGDTFEIELCVKGTTSLFTNDLAVYIVTDNSGEPNATAGSTMKESITNAYVTSAWTKQNASFTAPAGGLDKDTTYWLVIFSDEAYQFKTNRNIYYQFYTQREFPDGDYKVMKKTSNGSWWDYGFSAEFYFKILIPTTDGKVYSASCWGPEDDFPKIAIGLADADYSEDDTVNSVTFGTLSGVTIGDVENLGDNIYLDYGGGKLTADPPDILRTYAIGQVVSETAGDYEIKLNLENNLLLRDE